MSNNTVIVFGPTGNVGSVTALTAQSHGSKVYLAMRDPTKPIPGLSPSQEKTLDFSRVRADLSDPSSVSAAVEQSGATRAFIYLLFGSEDHMASTLLALQTSGITFVVFLSSYTVSRKHLPHISSSESNIISYVHARVEMNLAGIFREGNFVAVRPGTFATNTAWWKPQIAKGKVGVHRPDAGLDYITARDMGEVCGVILARGGKLTGSGEEKGDHVTIFGPELVPQREALGMISEELGREIEVVEVGVEEAVESHVAFGLPEVLARRTVNSYDETGDGKTVTDDPEFYRDAVDNIRKYTGREPTTFRTWLKGNLDIFQ